MKPALASIAALIAAAAALAPLHAATWKWKDSAGRIQFSDIPPPATVPDKDILSRPTTAVSRAPAPAAANTPPVPTPTKTDASTGPRTDPEIEARRKKAASDQDTQKKVQDEKDALVRAENCKRARGHLASLEDGIRLVRTNEKGEREVLDDKGRAEEMQRARSTIASDCR
jgi:Domain of unknown function (DUF4124)